MERLQRSPSVVGQKPRDQEFAAATVTLDNLSCILMLGIRSSPQICEARFETATCGDRFASLPISGTLRFVRIWRQACENTSPFPMESRKSSPRLVSGPATCINVKL